MIMNFDEYDLFIIMRIIYNLENNTGMRIEDYKYALNEIYETIEGYHGYASEIEEFCIDENGDLIKHTTDEYEKFLKYIYKSMINIYTQNIYNKGFENGLKEGRIQGYQGRELIAQLEEDVQTYR